MVYGEGTVRGRTLSGCVDGRAGTDDLVVEGPGRVRTDFHRRRNVEKG